MNKIVTNVSPGLVSLQDKVNLLRRLVDAAVAEAAVHDEFLNARKSSMSMRISLHGGRTVLSQVSFSNEGEIDEVFATVMKIMNNRVTEHYDRVKKVKDEL